MAPTRGAPARSRRIAVAALAAAFLATACGGPSPTASPTASPAPSPAGSPTPSATASGTIPSDGGPDAAAYQQVEAQVAAIRHLQPTTPIARHIVDAATLGATVMAAFRREQTPERLRSTEALDKALLLIPSTGSLDTYWTDLLTSQVIGMYDETTKAMYVVSSTGSIGPAERFIYSHEYTHALQDQAFGLTSVIGMATDQGDRTLARTMLVEGDATLAMTLWARDNLTPEQLVAVIGAADPASQAVLDRTPAILKDPLQAQYTNGFALAMGAYATGLYAGVDALFANPPDTTEQVLHPDKLASREAAVAVSLPTDLAGRLGTGWTVTMQDTLGEFRLEILLRDAGGSAAIDAVAAAAGWGGDRVALVDGPGGAQGVVLDTAWDMVKDAAEFATALDGLVARLRTAGRAAMVLHPAPQRVVLVTGDTAATVTALVTALGLSG